ncbi:PEGA domain-containing protein [bacterium]|nr:PEGA domain-containing protein [bacterium]
MNHLDTNWSESSFWERWQTVFLLLLVLILMSTIGVFIIGADGIGRIIGLVDDTYRGNLIVESTPADAILQIDFQPLTNSESREIAWARATDHIVDVQHPAFKPEKLMIRVPKDSGLLPFPSKTSDNISVEIFENQIKIRITLISEYVSKQIKSSPSGAAIEINGVSTKKTTPMIFEFKMGEEVIITAQKRGYETLTRTYKVLDSKDAEAILLTLKKIPKPKTPLGKLVLRNSYPVSVYSGSKRLINKKKAATIYLKPGNYTIRITNPKFLLDDTRSVKIRDGGSVTISLDAPGSMILETSPSNAKIFVEDKLLGQTPGTFLVAPGLYNVVFKWDNCQEDVSRWVKVVSEQTRKVPLVKGCQ